MRESEEELDRARKGEIGGGREKESVCVCTRDT